MRKKKDATPLPSEITEESIKQGRLAYFYELFRQAAEDVKKNGTFQTTKNDYEQVRPAYTAMLEMSDRIDSLLQKDGGNESEKKGKEPKPKEKVEFKLD